MKQNCIKIKLHCSQAFKNIPLPLLSRRRSCHIWTVCSSDAGHPSWETVSFLIFEDDLNEDLIKSMECNAHYFKKEPDIASSILKWHSFCNEINRKHKLTFLISFHWALHTKVLARQKMAIRHSLNFMQYGRHIHKIRIVSFICSLKK